MDDGNVVWGEEGCVVSGLGSCNLKDYGGYFRPYKCRQTPDSCYKEYYYYKEYRILSKKTSHFRVLFESIFTDCKKTQVCAIQSVVL